MAYREPLGGIEVRSVNGDVVLDAAPGRTVVLFVDATMADVTVTLPAAADCVGMTVRVTRVDDTGNVVEVDAPGTDTIIGANPFPIPFARADAVDFVSSGLLTIGSDPEAGYWGAF